MRHEHPRHDARAVIYEVGGPEQLKLEERPVLQPAPGQALFQIKAFGLNRSEMFTRLGHSKKVVTFPRVLGIECVGVVASCPSGAYEVGQQAAVIMGGLGRAFDGGYAEYTTVPEALIIPFASDLPWHVIGAVPEMCQTASGSLDAALELQPGETLLVRGGTSAQRASSWSSLEKPRPDHERSATSTVAPSPQRRAPHASSDPKRHTTNRGRKSGPQAKPRASRTREIHDARVLRLRPPQRTVCPNEPWYRPAHRR